MNEIESAERRAPEVRLTDETIRYLEERISAAVASGVAQTMTPEAAKNFWRTGFEVLREQTLRGTGDFVLSGLLAGIKKLLWVIGICIIVYASGGWGALKGFLAIAFSKG